MWFKAYSLSEGLLEALGTRDNRSRPQELSYLRPIVEIAPLDLRVGRSGGSQVGSYVVSCPLVWS